MNGVATGKSRAARRQGTRTLRPMIEFMEDRVLLATFTVTNNADSGPGSLRQAILNANTAPGTDTINFNIKVGAISEVPIPSPQTATPLSGSRPGPDGNLWFTEFAGNKIGRITPAGTITEFAVLTADSQPDGITAWPGRQPLVHRFAFAGNKIGRITPVPAPSPNSAIPTAFSQPCRITAGPDGNLWFTELTGNQIGRITPCGTITEFARSSRPAADPDGITAGPDGNLWFTEITGNKIGRITTAGTVTEFGAGHLTPGSVPDGITAGPDGNLWFTEDAGEPDRADHPLRHHHRVRPVITAGSVPDGITAGPDGNLWFTEQYGQPDRPDHPRRHDHRIRHPHAQQRPDGDHGRSRTATSGSPK